MTPWLLLDYGDVISRHLTEEALDEIGGRLGLDGATLTERYWRLRPTYDAGQAAVDYWPGVAGRGLTGAEVDALVDADRRGWAQLDPQMLDLIEEQRAAGVRLALLSNAPHFQGDAFDEVDWTDVFEQVFVSARIGLVKPDAAIFEHVVAELGAAPAEVTFVDDRQANVDAANDVGLRGLLFTGVDDLRTALRAGPTPG